MRLSPEATPERIVTTVYAAVRTKSIGRLALTTNRVAAVVVADSTGGAEAAMAVSDSNWYYRLPRGGTGSRWAVQVSVGSAAPAVGGKQRIDQARRVGLGQVRRVLRQQVVPDD